MPILSAAVAQFTASEYAHTLLAYATAFVLGTLIGLERQWRQRTAGLRTNVLVAVGAAAFTDLGMRLLGPAGATSLISYIISGIGFLGAGVILKDGTTIRGLNTGATLWCSAAVGALAGSGLPLEAMTLGAFVLAGNTLLRPLVNWVNRRPMGGGVTEAQYAVLVSCRPAQVSDVRDLIDAELDRLSYPIRAIEMRTASEDRVELEAVLVPTEAKQSDLDEVVAVLERSPLVLSATWSVEAES